MALPKSPTAERHTETLPQMPLPSREYKFAIFDANYLKDIQSYMSSWQCNRAVLVASKTLASKTSVISELESTLGSTLVGKKLGVGSHSPYSDVLEILKLLRKHQPNVLISIGSGSYSDACKIARLLHATLPPDADLDDEAMEKLVDPKKGRTPPDVLRDPNIKLIVVPTSLSAGEYNAVGSATNSNGKKEHFGAFERDAHAPDLILLDPLVARTSPRELWIMSGVRAIDHCVETMVAKGASNDCKKHCETGLRALIRGLKDYKDGIDVDNVSEEDKLLEGISKCQRGAREAITGLIVFRSHMGPSHAIGHQLGALGKVPHGMTSCVCLAPVLTYEKNHPESDFWDVSAQDIVLDIFNDVLDWNEQGAGDAIGRFVKELGMPTTLAEVNVTDEEILQKIAEHTMTDVWGGGEPQLESPSQVMQILDLVG